MKWLDALFKLEVKFSQPKTL